MDDCWERVTPCKEHPLYGIESAWCVTGQMPRIPSTVSGAPRTSFLAFISSREPSEGILTLIRHRFFYTTSYVVVILHTLPTAAIIPYHDPINKFISQRNEKSRMSLIVPPHYGAKRDKEHGAIVLSSLEIGGLRDDCCCVGNGICA